MQQIQTKRLLLREWQPSDLEPFANLTADQEVMKYFESTLTRQQSDALAQRIQAQIDTDGFGFFAAQRRDSGQMIGFIGVRRIRQGLPFAPCVEIGWRLARAHWGVGFATEGARACLKFAFGVQRVDQVVSFTPTLNRRSENVMIKLTMHKSADNFIHPALPATHPLAEHVLYKISHKQWLR